MIRPIAAADMAEITNLRTSVKENHLSVAQMAEYADDSTASRGEMRASMRSVPV